ncbi:Rieske (2Fe-2S) domain-containing protein (plasmid) [Rhodococcus opacus]|uniref:Rieske (2Fe-2S) domain-containing protein n=1 Tax=Rhodococcus opacus TaxID=37919 RepID=A0A1B1KH66_RHOOP|nr:aromatic ring-hydroxylating dioxygenase subunit alpha [Rhodococcus opacus]ANS31947.1 Rieske (2Fe-2S) domain-containing protein [Rhodococcus opacus]
MTITQSSTSPSVHDLVREITAQSKLPLETAVPLPTRTYWDHDFYELELENIFRKDWVCIARCEEVPDPGSYLAVDLANEPLIVVRGDDKKVRVFSRICRHRYEDLLGGQRDPQERRSGCVERFECPYHAWTYRLDGSLLNAPDMWSRPSFDAEAFGLRQINTHVWQGFVFVNLDEQTPFPFDMSGIERVQGNYDFTDWRLAANIAWGDSTANWKIMVENFSEAYHHIGAHMSSAQEMWPLGSVEIGDERGGEWFYSRMHVAAAAAVDEVDGHLIQPTWLPSQKGLSPYERSQGLLVLKFPTFMLLPAPDVTFWFRATPTGPETHHLDIALMVPKSNLAAPDFDRLITEAVDFFRPIQAEDASVNEKIQSTAKSQYSSGGVLHVHEQPLWQLQKYLASRLPASSTAY